MPYPRQLMQIDFDQFYRYAAVTTLLKPLIRAANPTLQKPIRVLEVGSHSLNLLPAFLAPLPVEIVRADLHKDFSDGTGPYVQLALNEPLRFSENSFDYIVALEVLEHIPREERSFAITEWARIAKQAIVLSCPNGKRVRAAEKRADRAYRSRHENEPHPWLDEHERFGQPTPREVRNLLREANLIHYSLANSPLAEWLPLLLATEEMQEQGSRELVKRFNEKLNMRPFRAFVRKTAPAYRKIYLGFKDELDAKQARQLWRHEFPAISASRSVEPAYFLARQFADLFKEGQANIVRNDELKMCQQNLREYRTLIDDLQKQSNHLRWTLESCGSWKAHLKRSCRSLLQRLHLFRSRFPAPYETHQLTEENGNWWYASGNDPQFVWNISYRSGWHRLVIDGQVLANQQAKLYIDYGYGFTERDAYLLGIWPAGLTRLSRFVYFHHPVKRLRLDPADQSTPMQFDRLSVTPRRAWHVALTGILPVLKDLVLRPHTTFKTLYDVAHHRRFSRFLIDQACGLSAKVGFSDNPYQAWLFAQRSSLRDRQAFCKQLQGSAVELVIILSLPKQWSQRDVQTTAKSLLNQDKEPQEIWLLASRDEQRQLLTFAELEPLRSKLRWAFVDSATPLSRGYRHCLEQTRASHCLALQMGDELEPDAIAQLLMAAREHPNAAIIYPDEDHYNDKHNYSQPLLKPDQAPESFLYQPFLSGKTAVIHCRLIRELGGFHPAYEGALLGELFHRVLRQKHEIAHVRRVLIHHPPNQSFSHGQPLVHERLVDEQRHYVTASRPQATSSISIIIPSAARMTTIEGKEEMHLARCLSSIRLKSTHHNYEIVVVHHDKLSHEAETVIAHFGASRVAVPGRFNFSRAINEAVKVTRGDQLLLLNDDTEVISPDWLEKLLFFSSQAEIGAVGAKLVFPNGYLQHIGIALSPEGPGHPYYRSPRKTSGYLNCCLAPRNWLAVTGACLMTSRRAFEAVHGLDETFELNYNDVDYCLRLWQAGYRCVCDPTIELYHYETMRADGRMKFRPEELQRFNARWAKKYPYDPYFTPEPA